MILPENSGKSKFPPCSSRGIRSIANRSWQHDKPVLQRRRSVRMSVVRETSEEISLALAKSRYLSQARLSEKSNVSYRDFRPQPASKF